MRQRWGRDLLHCPYCHGWEVRDQPIGVLGTHPGSAQHTQLVRQWSGDVVFFAHTYDLTTAERVQMQARGIRVVTGEVARLVVESDQLIGVELIDGRVITRTAIFIRSGHVPHADGLLSSWYERHDLGEEAVRHALAARNFDHAAFLMELAVPAI